MKTLAFLVLVLLPALCRGEVDRSFVPGEFVAVDRDSALIVHTDGSDHVMRVAKAGETFKVLTPESGGRVSVATKNQLGTEAAASIAADHLRHVSSRFAAPVVRATPYYASYEDAAPRAYTSETKRVLILFGIGIALIVALFGYVWMCSIPASISRSNGRDYAATFAISLILSPLVGLIFAATQRPNPDVLLRAAVRSGALKTCPKCAEAVKRVAVVCRFCGHHFGS